MVNGLDFSGLSNTLMKLHTNLRGIVKVQLVANELIGIKDKLFDDYSPVTLYEGDRAKAKEFVVSSKEEFLNSAPADGIDELVKNNTPENLARYYTAYKARGVALQAVIDRMFAELEVAQVVARAGQVLHKDLTGCLWDNLQLMG